MLISKLKRNLAAKIFLITCLLQMLACVLTYGFIAWVMPMTYTASRTQVLADETERLADQLKQSTLADCDQIISHFAASYDAAVFITDKNGITAADTYAEGQTEAGTRWQAIDLSDIEKNTIVSAGDANENWNAMQAIGDSFTFSNSPEIYHRMVVGSMQAVNQAVEVLDQVWPLLLIIILLISVFSSLFYTCFITRPIMRISDISQKMSALDFTWSCAEDRTDEIGILAHSLNELAGKLSVTMDELKKANASLQEDIDRERELEQARLDFFSAVSHELKTPITVIKGQLSGMLDGVGAYADRDKYLARSLTVVRQMEGIVQELLTVSRIEKGSGTIQAVPVDLSKLVQICLQEYVDLFEQKEQHIDTEISQNVKTCADPNLLRKAVRNVLTNASIYSPAGADISVTVRQENAQIILAVENAGIQIDPAALPHLFEAFYRVDASRNRQTGGSGLGLYLAKMIVEKYDGTICISNTEHGVSAVIQLPAIYE